MNDADTPGRPSICFIGLKCYDLLAGASTPRYIGGIESQLVLLARGLCEHGWQVAFVTFDHGQADGIEHGQIRVFKAHDPSGGVRYLRFVHPRWTGLWAAMGRANCDIYVQMGAGCETGQVALWCRKHHKGFLFAIASDSDCLRRLPRLNSELERALYRFGLSQAVTVVAQTTAQRSLLQAEFKLASVVVRASCSAPSPSSDLQHAEPRRKAADVLWVGRICEVKQPHVLLRIANELPQCLCHVVGESNRDTPYARWFRKVAKSCPSLMIHGKVSRAELERLYSTCSLLVSTSEVEGYPISFIEAWSYGLPVVSFVDPDNQIQRNGLGAVVPGAGAMARAVSGLLSSPSAWRACSQAARRFYLANHTPAVTMARYEQLLLQMVDRHIRPPGRGL